MSGSQIDYNEEDRTFNCAPTLNDTQVLDFCRNGHLVLEAAVPEEINQRTCDYLDGNLPADPAVLPPGLEVDDVERIRRAGDLSVIFLEDWFIQHVLLNPQLAGVLRALLGAHIGLPVLASPHCVECPEPAQGWHHDNDRIFGPELRFLEVFYFPQDTPASMGPTEVLPGSHIGPAKRPMEEKGVLIEGPAGTIGIHHQSILHRRAASTASGSRRMLKYNYWRTSPPRRDWLVEEAFDFQTAYYGHHETAIFYAHMFYWLCGKGDVFRVIGGQAWPWRLKEQIWPSYGFNLDEGYVPDWRRTGPDNYAVPPEHNQ